MCIHVYLLRLYVTISLRPTAIIHLLYEYIYNYMYVSVTNQLKHRVSHAELVDNNLCRLYGERHAVREGRHPLLKENFVPKILQFTGVSCDSFLCQLMIII